MSAECLIFANLKLDHVYSAKLGEKKAQKYRVLRVHKKGFYPSRPSARLCVDAAARGIGNYLPYALVF